MLTWIRRGQAGGISAIDRAVAEARPMFVFAPSQLRAARGLVDWSADDLAKVSGVSAATIRHFENGGGEPCLTTLSAIRAAFARTGVVFLDTNAAHGPGVALRNGRRT